MEFPKNIVVVFRFAKILYKPVRHTKNLKMLTLNKRTFIEINYCYI